MLACRNCRVAISAAKGCAVCDPLRRHLVVTEESEEERPSLSEVSSEVVSTLRAQLRYTRGCLKADPGDAGANSRLIMLGNTLAKTLEAARKLQQDGAEAVEQMSFKERADLFVNWFAALPPTYRSALKAKMDDFEAQLAVPQPQAEAEN